MTHLTLGFLITFLSYPVLKGRKISVFDVLLALVSLTSGWVTLTASAGVFMLSCSTIGWFMTSMQKWERVLLFIVSLLLIEGLLTTDIIAIALLIPVLLHQVAVSRKVKEGKSALGA